MVSFCDVQSNRRLMKCISKKDGKCYLFIGKRPSIVKVFKQINKNKKGGKESLFELSDENITELYAYLKNDTDTIPNMDEMKEYIIEGTGLEKYESFQFILDELNDDDTNEIILDKICFAEFRRYSLISLLRSSQTESRPKVHSLELMVSRWCT